MLHTQAQYLAMVMSNETTTFKVALRVQAKRAPPSTPEEWDLALALVNAEIHKQVSMLVKDLLGPESIVDVDTILTNICQPKLCAEIEADITIDHVARFPTPLLDYYIVSAFRRWVAENKDAYKHVSKAKVTWLGPNRAATLVGWRVDGLSSRMSSHEVDVFDIETKSFLNKLVDNKNNTCDEVVVLNQFMDECSRLEIHTAILGTSRADSTVPYQSEAIRLFNDIKLHSFVQQLDSSDPFFEPAFRAQAYALNDADIRVGDVRSPGKNMVPAGSSNRQLDLLNTTTVAIVLAFSAVGVLVSGFIFVALKKRATNSDEVSGDDDTSGES
mmetsp:Transcript_18223/g.30230  ORF Transcript_18223/g.30230 Transcript_18223/m.30230 type:complete len:329 (+) Transcript_18223:1815-2801(+)